LQHAEQFAAESERGEFEAVAEALGRSSRLANLLRYMGEHYLRGESDRLTEYNIATEVFGRSKELFDSGEDAIARVEAHRLRKRLKEFYDGPGKDRALQISIPLGTYIPAFVRHDDPQQIAKTSPPQHAVPVPPEESESAKDLVQEAEPHLSHALPVALFAGVVVIAAVTGIFAVSHRHSASPAASVASNPSPAAGALPLGVIPPAKMPLRMLAGYIGPPQTDSTGELWGADEYVHGGGPWRRTPALLAATSEPMLFDQWRLGDFNYDIPVRPGVYELHLYFVTTERSSDTWSTFNVRINGKLELQGFDINSDSLGEDIADERIFRDVTPATDGMIHISFASERGAPQLNALELLPGLPHKQLPIRLLMQRTSFTDHTGQLWHSDNYFTNGRLSDQHQLVTGTPDPDLFTEERYGHFRYTLPVDPRDRYALILHFAEFYFGPGMPGGGGTGSRVFRVLCNGETLLDDFDIYKEAGSLHALTKIFPHIKPSAQGKINLTFEPELNNATVSGIEVLDESQ
jgi:Malectin domain